MTKSTGIGRGRPPSGEPKRKPRSILFSDLEWAEVTAHAIGLGRPVSAWMREIVLAAVRR